MINLKETIEYKEYGYRIITCPICGKETLDNYWVCENCSWEYDGILEEDIFSDINEDTIKSYREKFRINNNAKTI